VEAGNEFDSIPIWLQLIGPPSGGKTELLFALQKCKQTILLSHFTPAALISGYREPPQERKDETAEDEPGDESEEPVEKDYSLLPQLNGMVVIIKDLSVILSMPAETRAQLLGLLRDAYDGYASRAMGNCDVKGYHSKFNLLAGMTPDIERCWSL